MDSIVQESYDKLVSCIDENRVELSDQLIIELKQRRDNNKLKDDKLIELFKRTGSRNISSQTRQSLITHLIQPSFAAELQPFQLNTDHPLWICVGCGDVESSKLLLENNKFDLNVYFDGSKPLLHHAVCENYQNPRDCIKIIDLLVKNEADIKAEDITGRSVMDLMIKTDSWNTEVADFLFEKGSFAREGYFLLYRAVSRNSSEKDQTLAMIDWLLDRGIDINSKPGDGKSGLLWPPLIQRDIPLIEFLLGRGVIVNEQDKNTLGETLLHEACSMTHMTIVKLLLEAGGEAIVARNNANITPFQEVLIKPDKKSRHIAYVFVIEFAKVKFSEEINPSQVTIDLQEDLQLVGEDPDLKYHYGSCLDELRRMNAPTLHNSITMYQMLFAKTIYQLVLLFKNRRFSKSFNGQKKEVFLYRSHLLRKIKNVRKLKKAMDKLDNKLYSTIGRLLPAVVMRIILEFLYKLELYI